MRKLILTVIGGVFAASSLIAGITIVQAATGAQFTAIPPFVNSGSPPLVMLAMGRDHKLYYEAYNDASDLDNDNKLDIHYKPSINYYGYFDNYKCYTYSTAATPNRFNPTSKTADKKCTGADEWSGDFLNYLTMSRMDTVRKVLYGGYRSTDTATETVLQRVYVPRDAHSWGKEYTSVAVDGYDIADYTPFTVPAAGLRHLFASTTFTSPTSAPLLRYALGSTHRIWDWLVTEAPILKNSTVEVAGGTTYAGYPGNHTAYETLVTDYATATYLYGTGSWLNYSARNHTDERYTGASTTDYGAIDGAGNPYGTNYNPYSSGAAQQEHYLAIFTGKIKVDTTGDYIFGVDGDDAVEVIVKGGTADQIIVGDYGAHGTRGSAQYIDGSQSGSVQVSNSNTTHLVAGVEYRIEFRMMEYGGGDKYYLYWNGPDSGSAWQIIPAQKFTDLTLSTYHLDKTTAGVTVVDREVRVKVCDESVGLEANCKQYPNGNYKPIGLLQRHGETKRMYFGLMTGSYAKSTSGGVLRKKIGDISDEIETTTTGTFKTAVNGIVQTLNKLRIYGFNDTSYNYDKNCGWITTGVMAEGQCRDWGNPIAEIMYEATRYFAGKGEGTSIFDYSGTTDDSNLDLPKVDVDKWKNPYNKADGGYDNCSKPFILAISDINPNFDTDQLPGVDTDLGGAGITTDLTGLDVKTLAKNISTNEGLANKHRFIGRFDTNFDSVCSAKTLADGLGQYILGSASGLCPEEPTKRGGYYSASVAYYAHTTDLQTAVDRDQKVTTHAVGLASPLPKIEIRIGPAKKLVTLVPFGKTVSSRSSATSNSGDWAYKPTNTITDFFVEELGDTYGRFQLNFEDVEQGADHDMDAVVRYEYQLVDAADNNVSDPLLAAKVKITLTSGVASGSYIQHLGYIISGTELADGPYLEVRDGDTEQAADFYWAGHDTLPVGDITGKLPQVTSRTFTPATAATSSTAELLPNPLWYAAKYGAFEEEKESANGIPDIKKEWDKDDDGSPDTYYYVSNPLRLEEQLNKSFADILNKASSGTAASVISNTRSGEGAVYQSIFFPERSDSTANTVNWVGQLHALLVDSYGNMREDSNHNGRLDVSVKNLDLNGDHVVRNEDVNMNCTLDAQTVPTIDVNGDGVLDSKDLLKEDLNGNGTLDNEYTGCPGTLAANPFASQLDTIIIFKEGKFSRHFDVNGNGILDPLEEAFPAATNIAFDDSNYLWNSSSWLNTIADADIPTQRSTYISNEKKRYIFTYVDSDKTGTVYPDEWDDKDKDGVVDTGEWADINSDSVMDRGEVQDFIWPASGAPTVGTISSLADTSKFYAYLNLYSSFADRPKAINDLITTTVESPVDDPYFKEFLVKQTQREINWIRGLDELNTNGTEKPLHINTSDIAGTELRSRLYNGKTWRLGDIAYSTPTTVAAPAEAYHLLYKDSSYDAFYRKYQGRRNVIYTGANDGMLHAFNGGFYDSYSKQFCREMRSGYDPLDGSTSNDVPCVDIATTTHPELGAELWAYVPYNLLPHLYWLTQTNYTHIYYVDEKPRVFDAKIFNADTTHVNGWGTIMVVGMRFGGSTITADVDKLDGAGVNTNVDRTMRSAFVIMDITDPEQKPKLLGEITMPNMGYSTCYPTMVIMKDGDHDGVYGNYNQAGPANGENRWFLAFGSGPATASGEPDSSLLNTATSSQAGRFYLLDMNQLAQYNTLQSLTDSGTTHGVLTAGLHPYYILPTSGTNAEPNSFISDPVTVDYDLDFNADAVYYGTINGNAGSGYGGVMHRIVMDDRNDITTWYQDKILIDLNQESPRQPISAGASIAVDDAGRNWIFFGTGRYFVSADAFDVSKQSYYGIKEPVVDPNVSPLVKTWATVDRLNLANTTNYHVFTDEAQTVSHNGTPTTWDDIVAEQKYKDGWYLDFMDAATIGDTKTLLRGERNLGQAALIGGILSFTTFIPSQDVCVAGGESFLWALYYQTGTAYFDSILGIDKWTFDGKSLGESRPRLSLGQGLATSPNIHVGGEEGSAVFVQTSTGDIVRIEEKNPLSTKSGKTSWKLR